MELRPLQKSVKLFITMFSCMLLVDVVAQFCAQNYGNMTSSIVCLSGMLVSGILIRYNKYELGIFILGIVFYIVGLFHTIALGNYVTCYFVLIVVPIVGAVLLENFYNKIALIIVSSILFPVCNYFAGLGLLDNYFFYYGLFPTSFLMLHFYNKLVALANDKNNLIAALEDKNEDVLLFSNMMSHDLKAPLRSIGGFSAILQRKLKGLDEKDSEMFSFITNGVKAMGNLIEDLLQYSKFSVDKFSFSKIEFDILIDKLVQTFNYDIDINRIEIIKNDLSFIYGNQDSIYLVFQNLISNSIKFQPKDKNHKPVITICQSSDEDFNIISIADNGIGIDEGEIEDIFLPFKRFHSDSEYEGTGLGMSIVNKIIEKHNGCIEVDSELGAGTRFTISLPKS